MDPFLLFYRLIAVAIVVFWIWQLMTTRGKPIDWRPPRAERFRAPITRDRYRVASVLGMAAGLGVFALSYVLPFAT